MFASGNPDSYIVTKVTHNLISKAETETKALVSTPPPLENKDYNGKNGLYISLKCPFLGSVIRWEQSSEGLKGRQGKCLRKCPEVTWKSVICWVSQGLYEIWCKTSNRKEVYQISSSMLHLESGYDLSLSLYKHVQNDCQIYRPLSFSFVFSLNFWKCSQFGASSVEVHSAVSLLWFGWFFFFLLIALVTALPQKNFYPPYWFCPQEHTDTHTKGLFHSVFIYFLLLTLWCKINCVHVQVWVFFLNA